LPPGHADIFTPHRAAAKFPLQVPPDANKKRAAVAGGSKVNREASNRVDRSHSMSRRWTIRVIREKA
jgi:hypothetical protein